MTDTGLLVVHRTAGTRRIRRFGKVDVRVDDRVRGQARAGDQIELKMSAGPHRVQVGREAVTGPNRQLFVGSPVLAVTIRTGQTTRVRMDPTSVPVRQQLQVAESSYTLTEEIDGADGRVTEPPVAELDRYPVGLWMAGLYTRSLLERPRPWRSWQAAASALLLLYAMLLVVLVATGRRPANVGAWVWTVFVVGGGAMTVVAWASLYRARHKLGVRSHT